jgi:hypothetical protein
MNLMNPHELRDPMNPNKPVGRPYDIARWPRPPLGAGDRSSGSSRPLGFGRLGSPGCSG